MDTTQTPPPPPPQTGNGQPKINADHGQDDIPADLHKPHWLTVTAVALLFAGLLVALYFMGLGPHQREREQAQGDAQEQTSLIPSVNVSLPTRDAAAHTIVLPCDIRPNQDTMIYSRTSGYLRKFYKDIGDHVAAEELLAEIDVPEVDAELEQAKASQLQADAAVAKAQADLDLAQRTLVRYDNIPDTAVTRQERDEVTSARDQANAALAQAKANVKVAAANVDRLTVMQSFDKITAPFDGIVTERNYDVGALLSGGDPAPGRQLFRVTQATTLRVFVNVPQVESSLITLGSPAKLQVRNFPDKEFTGTVAPLAGALDPSTRTMPFELHFPNPHNELFAGMYGEIHLDITQSNHVLVVPTSALIFNASGVHLAVVQDGKVHFKPVSLGNDRGTELEITAGLSENDQVITNPGERLAEGSAVQAIDAPKTALAASPSGAAEPASGR